MPKTIRLAEHSDVAAMAGLRAQEWGEKVFWTDRIARYIRGEHSPQHALPERGVFVAVDNGTVVGFVAGHRTRRFDCDGELQWINVAEAKRGEGIGYKLLERIGAWFVEHNVQRVCVNVAATNSNARRLYSRYGAKPFKQAWMVWDDVRSMGMNKRPSEGM